MNRLLIARFVSVLVGAAVLFGALHGHLSGMLLATYPDAILSLNLFPNRPTDT